MEDPPVFPSLDQRSGWRAIRHWLLSGGVAGFPAEYAYALSEVPTRRPSGARYRLYRIKDRSPGKPILYLAGNLNVVERFAFLPDDRSRLRFIAGSPRFLTCLLRARPLAESLGMANSGKVAFRIPADKVLRDFLNFLGEPLSGTSLNISGTPPLKTPEAIRRSFPDLAIVDGGFRPGHPVSPVLDLTPFDRRVLRGSWVKIISERRDLRFR
ncbi:MAG: Sua5/YciO/YrdC/YwlC family protein [Nitrospirota bacterium]|nr:Sua5/YciO/YrdC/YwlC family protein [Nitrospirota bacterium]